MTYGAGGALNTVGEGKVPPCQMREKALAS